ncbi:hypothetical protein RclHR1_11500007 [Rhizophagus clarus]|uniref:Nucleoside diphosphate-linked moiety X motif 8, mitochondrial-like n=1 Tax=Rhizophagus clarus TaxID=94130 RepID=A0A2Z6Q8V9_9GLOM|nr:hypothetical protein RclHR1_11500007 [Rhizophagus clarus]GES81517.1 nucleoside diphosphate-linked moiety X motif 8, mitochondrial-like [Rhizophagus clarus]
MIIKQLNPSYLKNIKSKKISTTLITNLQQNQYRSHTSNSSLPLYYNNNNNGMMDITDFSSESIELIRYRLNSCNKLNYKFNYDTTKKVGEAAVLMPLCIVNGKPSVLFTIRSMSLKTHTGEVSFPGGKRDLTDLSLESTALRETYEEIGIPPSQIEILGQDSIMPNKDRTMKVYPFVGFIKYPIDISKINFNHDEVKGVFSVTLKDLLNHDNRKWGRFSNSKLKYPIFEAQNGFKIWGLTAFILENVLRKINPLRKS